VIQKQILIQPQPKTTELPEQSAYKNLQENYRKNTIANVMEVDITAKNNFFIPLMQLALPVSLSRVS